MGLIADIDIICQIRRQILGGLEANHDHTWYRTTSHSLASSKHCLGMNGYKQNPNDPWRGDAF